MSEQQPANTPTQIQTKPGKPYPLGATYDGDGVNFALFSEHATAVYLCLYDPADPTSETSRLPLREHTDLVWHIYIDGLQPGQLYGFRVDGLYDPKAGNFFNACKLLLDPYARAINAPIGHDDSWLGYDYRNPSEERYLIKSEEDSGPTMPKSVVIDPAFDWEDDAAPATPMHRSVIYELHVKGFTHRHPTMNKSIRGTYAGLGAPESTDYLKKLGITAVELLPVHQFTNESYWGYNSIGFFAPQNTYSSSMADGRTGKKGAATEVVTEFKEMVKSLHKAGIEVVLDVVYNHTAEGNHFGPMLSFQGIDNRAYYHQVGDSPEHYMDYTGTGNTFNLSHPRALQLVMDSLRYWVTDMHVDGFRFDLASALVRTDEEAGRVSSFLDTVAQDPVLARVKLIAEPWDIQSYHVGGFPVQWSEWNGKFRDTFRAFWKGDEGKAGEATMRLLGSPDLYADGRSPANSVNLITAHDGFTLNDLVSYNEKHNEANGEHNNDGSNDNLSWNCGAEGPTDDPVISDLRERQKRNFLATMLLSQGTPMLVMGDECGRTQHGNNNGYNQDSEISWMNWDWTDKQQALFDFTNQLTALRREIPLLSRRKFFGNEQVAYLRPDGQEMTADDLGNPNTHCFALFMDGLRVDEQTEDGEDIGDEQLVWILNAYWEDIPFMLPKIGRKTASWEVIVDTSTGQLSPDRKSVV